jgi:hypothetical protein
MEKKTYMHPATEVLDIQMEELLNTVSGSTGIGYGGVDNGGTKDPASRLFEDIGFEDE